MSYDIWTSIFDLYSIYYVKRFKIKRTLIYNVIISGGGFGGKKYRISALSAAVAVAARK